MKFICKHVHEIKPFYLFNDRGQGWGVQLWGGGIYNYCGGGCDGLDRLRLKNFQSPETKLYLYQTFKNFNNPDREGF